MNEFLPNVSLVIAVYNEEITLESCIQSILQLDYPKEKTEFIFVDNGSTDKTLEILDKYRKQIKIFHEPKRGAPAARNKGIREASGEVIAFTDADCVVDKDWLKQIVQPLKDKNIGIVGGKILSTQPANYVEKYCEKIHDHEREITKYRQTPYVITMNWASRQTVLQEVGLFDQRFIRSQDVDLSHRIFKAGYQLVYESKASIYHHNEKTLRSLFRRGLVNGYWAVNFRKLHRKSGLRSDTYKIDINGYRKIFRSARNFLSGYDRGNSFCDFTFNTGKKLGKIFGSIRFLHLEL